MGIEARFGVNVGKVDSSSGVSQAYNRAAKRDESNTFQDWGKATATSTAAVSNVALNIQKQANVSEAIAARTDYLLAVESEGYVNNMTPIEQQETLQALQDNAQEKGGSYFDAYVSVAGSETTRVSAAVGKATGLTGLNNIDAFEISYAGQTNASGITDDEYNPVTNKEAGYTKEDVVEAFHKQYPQTTRRDARDALIAFGQLEKISNVRAATTPEELAQAIVNNDAVDEDFNSPMFTNKASPEVAEKTRLQKLDLNNMVKIKESQFKDEANGRLAKAAESGYRVAPSDVEDDIDYTSDNKYSAAKAKIAYNKKFIERTEADSYNATVPIGSRRSALPDNKLLKEDRQKIVTSVLTNHFNAGSMGEFVRIANNEQDMTGDTGTAFLTLFNSASTPGEAKLLLDKFNSIDAHPQGATVLTQMMSADEFTRLKTVGYVMQGRPELTVGEARDIVDKNMGSLNQMKLSPDLNADMLNYATKLGTSYDAYLTHMQQVLKGNPNAGKKEILDAYNTFKKRQTKDATGVKINTSMGADITKDPSVMNEKRTTSNINKLLDIDDGDTGSEKIAIGKDIILKVDKFGGFSKIINTKGVIQESNKQEEEFLKVERDKENAILKGESGTFMKHLFKTKHAVKDTFRYAVDNSLDIILAAPKVGKELVGNMASRFSDHLYDSMTKGQQEWWDSITEDDKSELVLETVSDSIVTNTVDPEALSGITNVTLSPEDRRIFDNAIFKAESTKEKAQTMVSLIVKEEAADKLIDIADVKALTDKTDIKEIQKTLGFKGKGIDGVVGGGVRNGVMKHNRDVILEGKPRGSGMGIDYVADGIDRLTKAQIQRIIDIESGGSGYNAMNPITGAFGKYQFTNGTAKDIMKELFLEGDEWMTPENQDDMFIVNTNKNIDSLEKALDSTNITLLDIYGSHQLGFAGYKEVISGNVEPARVEAMKKNLPKSLYEGKKDSEIGTIWLQYWDRRTKI